MSPAMPAKLVVNVAGLDAGGGDCDIDDDDEDDDDELAFDLSPWLVDWFGFDAAGIMGAYIWLVGLADGGWNIFKKSNI